MTGRGEAADESVPHAEPHVELGVDARFHRAGDGAAGVLEEDLVLQEQSVRNLTMEAVAKRAQVGKPTLCKWCSQVLRGVRP